MLGCKSMDLSLPLSLSLSLSLSLQGGGRKGGGVEKERLGCSKEAEEKVERHRQQIKDQINN